MRGVHTESAAGGRRYRFVAIGKHNLPTNEPTGSCSIGRSADSEGIAVVQLTCHHGFNKTVKMRGCGLFLGRVRAGNVKPCCVHSTIVSMIIHEGYISIPAVKIASLFSYHLASKKYAIAYAVQCIPEFQLIEIKNT